MVLWDLLYMDNDEESHVGWLIWIFEKRVSFLPQYEYGTDYSCSFVNIDIK